MQYVGNLFNTVTEFYKELNPSTLSGAIDVIVVRHRDGSLHCSPFHVRFGLLQLLKPNEKVVEVEVNGKVLDYRMKLGESGEAFFVFESENPVPSEFATSPILSPDSNDSEDMDYFALPESEMTNGESPKLVEEPKVDENLTADELQMKGGSHGKHLSNDTIKSNIVQSGGDNLILDKKGYNSRTVGKRNQSSINTIHASTEGLNSQYLKGHSHKSNFNEDRGVRSDGDADNALSEDDIYSDYKNNDIAFSDSEIDIKFNEETSISKVESYSESSNVGTYKRWTSWFRRSTQNMVLSSDDEEPNPTTPPTLSKAERKLRRSKVDLDNKSSEKVKLRTTNYAKTLRLTSDQLKTIDLQPGANPVVFTVGKASCTSRIFLWEQDDKVVISDIDGTITKSDALGHLFNMVGKDWTHPGVAKLYTDIVKNGYRLLYLTSRAIGQADTTREYLRGIDQNQFQLPDGPVIMSPDRLFQSLHREVVLRKPHLFKMACLKDILSLFGQQNTTFYAGFGNRITDALSYRSVHVPVSRIFTIDYNGELHHELIVAYNSSYIKLTDLVDQIFPPVYSKLDEDFNDWNYWKPTFPDIDLPFEEKEREDTLPKVEAKLKQEIREEENKASKQGSDKIEEIDQFLEDLNGEDLGLDEVEDEVIIDES